MEEIPPRLRVEIRRIAFFDRDKVRVKIEVIGEGIAISFKAGEYTVNLLDNPKEVKRHLKEIEREVGRIKRKLKRNLKTLLSYEMKTDTVVV